jgi:hypothetical protein
MARTRDAVLESCIEQDVAHREKPQARYWWRESTKPVLVLNGGSYAE